MKFYISEYMSNGLLLDFLDFSHDIYLELSVYGHFKFEIRVPNPNKQKNKPATVLYTRNYFEGFSKQRVRIDKKRGRNK